MYAGCPALLVMTSEPATQPSLVHPAVSLVYPAKISQTSQCPTIADFVQQ